MNARSQAGKRRLWPRRLRRLLLGVVLLPVAACATWLLLPKPELFPPGLTFSRRVFDRDGKLIHLTLSADGKYRLPAKLDAVSPHVLAATLAKEDHRYFKHAGVDVRSAARAAWGVVSGQRLGGGSTVTMQYARLRYRLKTRSWWGKAVQAFRAIQLERHYEKRELLEAYLTLAPYGGNVEGITAASFIWCGKTPDALSEREAVALSVIPQSPAKRRPRADANPELAEAQARLLARLRGHSSPSDAHFSLTPTGAPRHVPHLARRLLTTSTASEIPTTIHLHQQESVERAMRDFLHRWRDRGLRNGAAILVHAPTREVRAYTGSADFHNADISGQVDGVTARRSPGSALKPFIYALALDAGLIHPGTLLDDAPRQFAAYNPENSDRAYLGPIPAAEALRRSRNLPAIELLSKLPRGGLDRFLRESGVPLELAPGEYGLSLALGGAEVALEDLAMLYAALATDGAPEPLRFTPEQRRGSSAPLLSPAARWLTRQALRDPHSTARGLVWKTGTSHGFRDAWACGMVGEWVLCVWIGNFDAKPMPGLFARDTAAPLLLEMVQRLGLSAPAPKQPPSVVLAALCSDSGMIAAPCCPHVRHVPFIAGISPISVCDVHREVYLNARGLQVRAGEVGAQRVVREFWPQHRLEQFRRAGLPRMEPPAWSGGIEQRSFAAPQIISPQAALTYVLQPHSAGKRAIPLQARAASGVQRIHWFAGAQYLGSAPPAQPLLWSAAPGRWILQASDDHGHTASVAVTVSHSPQ